MIAAWLLVTVRREALRHLQRSTREVLTDEPPSPREPESTGPASALIEGERRTAVLAAVRRLPSHQRPLVDPAITDAGTSYADLSVQLGMPIGSIGPTRGRILERLSRDSQLIAAVAA